jgi:4-hydroxybenzoate polyprenyltransferase
LDKRVVVNLMRIELAQRAVTGSEQVMGTETSRSYFGRRPVRGLIRLSRPWHWVKNVFILLPLPFVAAAQAKGQALGLGQFVYELGPFAIGFVGFCLVNSGVYALNDVIDAEADRLHSKKRNRPVASGDVAAPLAVVWALVLLAAGLALGWIAAFDARGLSTQTDGSHEAWRQYSLAVAVIYVALNLAYSLGAKHVTLLDIFLVSAGFVLRVLLGCYLLGVPASNWLVLCSSALALFLGSAKRRADLAAGLPAEHRPSLAGYDITFLNQMLGITATVTLMAYCLYSRESPVFIEGRQLASVPFVAYGVLHYLRVALIHGAGASPVAMFYTSRTLQICGVCWLVAVTWSVGLW